MALEFHGFGDGPLEVGIDTRSQPVTWERVPLSCRYTLVIGLRVMREPNLPKRGRPPHAPRTLTVFAHPTPSPLFIPNIDFARKRVSTVRSLYLLPCPP